MTFPLNLWSPIEVRRTIPASTEVVFAVMSDPTTYPRWLLGAQRIRHVDPEFPRPGSEFHHSVGPTDDVTVDDRSEVLESDAPTWLVLRVHVGPVHGRVELLVRPDGEQSEVCFRETTEGWAKACMPLARVALLGRNARSLRLLEELVTE